MLQCWLISYLSCQLESLTYYSGAHKLDERCKSSVKYKLGNEQSTLILCLYSSAEGVSQCFVFYRLL